MDLKDKFERDRPAVDNRTLPPDDFAIYMGKMKRKRLSDIVFRTAASACAAAAAVVLALVVWSPGPSAEKIYSDYLSYVESSRQELSLRDDGGEWLDVFDSVAEEAVPIIRTLPEDLQERDRARVVKEHYDNLRNGLETIMASSR